MPHDHVHGHDHAQPHAARSALAIGAAINLAYVIVEAIFGIAVHSTALLADAGHNLGDVICLIGGAVAVWLGQRAPSGRFTYGMRRASVLAALANAVILLLVTGAIAADAAWRLANPRPTAGFVIMGVAIAGVLVNGVSAWLLAAGRKGDLNLRAAFTHMAADVGLAAGVAVAGLVIALTGWDRLDSAVSLIIAVVIVRATWSVLAEAVSMSLDAVPDAIDSAAVSACLSAMPGVREVHDLHIWALSTTETALTAHLVRDDPANDQALLATVPVELRAHFGIGHATVQLETPSAAHGCGLRSAEVI